MIPTILAQNKIKQYEYWLDGDFTGRQIVAVTPSVNFELDSISVNNIIKPGLHRLNIRFVDTNNKFSAVLTQFIEGFTASPKITSCEYWFDNTYANKTVVSLTPSSAIILQNIDISAVSNGMHSFNIRFLDRAAKWSAVQATKLYKSSGDNVLKNSVTGYRYWFDKNFGSYVYKNLSTWPIVLSSTETLDLSTFPKGNNHVFNIQFKDALGLWSAVQSTNIYNLGVGNALNNGITAYRYWIDSDFVNCIYKTVNPSLTFVSVDESVDLSTFPNGNNRKLHVQFKDALGMWSSVISDTVNVVVNAGINNAILDADKIQVYPNPSKGELTISTNRTFYDASLFITNTLGKTVFSHRFDALNGAYIDLTSLPDGIYFLRVVENNENIKFTTQKIILQK